MGKLKNFQSLEVSTARTMQRQSDGSGDEKGFFSQRERVACRKRDGFLPPTPRMSRRRRRHRLVVVMQLQPNQVSGIIKNLQGFVKVFGKRLISIFHMLVCIKTFPVAFILVCCFSLPSFSLFFFNFLCDLQSGGFLFQLF